MIERSRKSQREINYAVDKKRKPASNHPDYAGLATTSNVTSLKINTSVFIPIHPPASYPFAVILTMSLCREAIMHVFAKTKNEQTRQLL